MEGHSRPARHRRVVVRRVHAAQALHEEPARVRVPLRPRRHRPAADHQPGGSVDQEEEWQVE